MSPISENSNERFLEALSRTVISYRDRDYLLSVDTEYALYSYRIEDLDLIKRALYFKDIDVKPIAEASVEGTNDTVYKISIPAGNNKDKQLFLNVLSAAYADEAAAHLRGQPYYQEAYIFTENEGGWYESEDTRIIRELNARNLNFAGAYGFCDYKDNRWYDGAWDRIARTRTIEKMLDDKSIRQAIERYDNRLLNALKEMFDTGKSPEELAPQQGVFKRRRFSWSLAQPLLELKLFVLEHDSAAMERKQKRGYASHQQDQLPEELFDFARNHIPNQFVRDYARSDDRHIIDSLSSDCGKVVNI